jgi:hypothetical protein
MSIFEEPSSKHGVLFYSESGDEPSVAIAFADHYLRIDECGRLVFDQCPTDHEHFSHNPPTEDDQSICRNVLTNLVPSHMLQRKGKWRVTFTLEPE